MRNLARFLLLSLMVVPFELPAYELATHARITEQVYAEAVLTTDPTLLSDWGLSQLDPVEPFGKIYYEIINGSVEARSGLDFVVDRELDLIPFDQRNNSFSIQGWLVRGAIREDDYPNQSFLFGLCKIDDAPPIPAEENPLSRPVNHFYDPVNDIGITGSERATDWGLGANNALQIPNQPDIGRVNHYTIVDAREAMYRALTGQASNGNPNIGPGGTAADKSVLNAYWATTFRILGDVVHLVQDMGQPQHTRNDSHAGICGVTGAKSVYEAYIDARAKGSEFTTPSGTSILPDPLNYTGYPVPQFNDYVSYFTTRHLDGANPLARRGLADYSNRGFFSAGKNMFAPANEYSLPEQNPPAYGRMDVTVDWSGNPLPNNGKVELLTHTVPDTLTGETPSATLTTFGLWDQFLEERSFLSRYTLTRTNYDDMANLLIPRAVAYSSGLINYFFRGRLEITQSTADGSGIGLNVMNASGGLILKNGNFEVYYDLLNGTRIPLTVTSGGTVNNLGLADGATQTILAETSDGSTIDAGAEVIIVFRGTIGEEDGIAAISTVVTALFLAHPDSAGTLRWYRSSDLGDSWVGYGTAGNGWPAYQLVYAGNRTILLNQGVISRSVDSGQTWTTVVASPTVGQIEYVGQNVVLGGGASSNEQTTQVQRSTDNGQTWSTLTVGSYGSISNLEYLGNGVVLATTQFTVLNPNGQGNLSSESALLKSTDRGSSWSLLERLECGETTNSGAWSAHLGWLDFAYMEQDQLFTYRSPACNQPVAPYWSADGGATWAPSSISLEGFTNRMRIAYVGNGVAILPASHASWGSEWEAVLRTTNRGQSWGTTSQSYLWGFAETVIPIGIGSAAAIGNNLENSHNVYITTDGGLSWTKKQGGFTPIDERFVKLLYVGENIHPGIPGLYNEE